MSLGFTSSRAFRRRWRPIGAFFSTEEAREGAAGGVEAFCRAPGDDGPATDGEERLAGVPERADAGELRDASGAGCEL